MTISSEDLSKTKISHKDQITTKKFITKIHLNTTTLMKIHNPNPLTGNNNPRQTKTKILCLIDPLTHSPSNNQLNPTYFPNLLSSSASMSNRKCRLSLNRNFPNPKMNLSSSMSDSLNTYYI